MSGLSSADRPMACRRSSIDSWRTSNPSSSAVKVALNSKRWCSIPTALEAGEGFLEGRVVREDPVEGRELEHDADLLVRGCQAKLTLAAADLLECRDHRTESRGVDKADPF